MSRTAAARAGHPCERHLSGGTVETCTDLSTQPSVRGDEETTPSGRAQQIGSAPFVCIEHGPVLAQHSDFTRNGDGEHIDLRAGKGQNHAPNISPTVSKMSLMFSTVSTPVASHPSTTAHRGFAKLPMILFDEVNQTSGTIETGSAMQRNT